MRQTKTATGLFLFPVMIAACLAFGWFITLRQGAASDSNVLHFDVKWWQQAASEEQQGFVYGYMDCRQPSKSSNASIDDYQNAVSGALETRKTTDQSAVTKAIEHAWATLKPRNIQGGENYSGPHGFLDGEWWGGFQGPWPPRLAAADQGYLEGYLACSSPPVTVQAVHRYQTALNKHYASGRYSHDKIADILRRLLKPTG